MRCCSWFSWWKCPLAYSAVSETTRPAPPGTWCWNSYHERTRGTGRRLSSPLRRVTSESFVGSLGRLGHRASRIGNGTRSARHQARSDRLLIDTRGRYSLTHFQIVLWSLIVISLITGLFWLHAHRCCRLRHSHLHHQRRQAGGRPHDPYFQWNSADPFSESITPVISPGNCRSGRVLPRVLRSISNGWERCLPGPCWPSQGP